jgi:hypothetical protein
MRERGTKRRERIVTFSTSHSKYLHDLYDFYRCIDMWSSFNCGALSLFAAALESSAHCRV